MLKCFTGMFRGLQNKLIKTRNVVSAPGPIMPLGYIMLYNHSKNPTIWLESDYEEMTMTARALRDIEVGEELTWDYSCEIWFDED